MSGAKRHILLPVCIASRWTAVLRTSHLVVAVLAEASHLGGHNLQLRAPFSCTARLVRKYADIAGAGRASWLWCVYACSRRLHLPTPSSLCMALKNRALSCHMPCRQIHNFRAPSFPGLVACKSGNPGVPNQLARPSLLPVRGDACDGLPCMLTSMQDTLGNRQACEDACFAALTAGSNVVVDR